MIPRLAPGLNVLIGLVGGEDGEEPRAAVCVYMREDTELRCKQSGTQSGGSESEKKLRGVKVRRGPETT